MSASIYLEGGAKGAHSKYLNISCQEAFHKLLDNMGFKGRKPRLVVCGGRGSTFDRFSTAHKISGKDYIALWIDSEDPVKDHDKTWAHLKNRKGDEWDRPEGATDDQVLFMTTCMETWIAADRKTLQKHYGKDLQESALPPLDNLENRHRHDVHDKLERATRDCSNAYAKGKRSFALLAELNPKELEKLPSFARVVRILKQKL